ncbi:MAG: hypothetical protein AAGK04_05010 [Planctomycetota bacterium]
MPHTARIALNLLVFTLVGLATAVAIAMWSTLRHHRYTLMERFEAWEDEGSAYRIRTSSGPLHDAVTVSVVSRDWLEDEVANLNEILEHRGRRRYLEFPEFGFIRSWGEPPTTEEPITLIGAPMDRTQARSRLPFGFATPDPSEISEDDRIWQCWGTATGWPMRALWYGSAGDRYLPDMAFEDTDPRNADVLWKTFAWGTLRYSKELGAVEVTIDRLATPAHDGRRWLPIRPMWIGLLANSALYTLAWWVLLRVPVWTSRGLRRDAGLCVGCGYDLADSPGACPECGRVTPPRRGRRSAST